jgi:hypothetical protein
MLILFGVVACHVVDITGAADVEVSRILKEHGVTLILAMPSDHISYRDMIDTLSTDFRS